MRHLGSGISGSGIGKKDAARKMGAEESGGNDGLQARLANEIFMEACMGLQSLAAACLGSLELAD
jgi:hypothetical protein